jgi:TPR repeat protein
MAPSTVLAGALARRVPTLFLIFGVAFFCASQPALTAAVRQDRTELHPNAEMEFALALEAQSAREYDVMLSHLRRAAEANHVPAQELLGIALLGGETLYGPAVPRDYCEAIKWFRRAHLSGSEIGTVYNTLLLQLAIGYHKCGDRY